MIFHYIVNDAGRIGTAVGKDQAVAIKHAKTKGPTAAMKDKGVATLGVDASLGSIFA